MNKFRAKVLCIRVRNLTAIKDNFHRLSGQDPTFSLEQTTTQLLAEINHAIADCRVIGLSDAATTLMHVKQAVSSGRLDAPRLEREAVRAHDALLDDINKLSWVYVEPHFIQYLDQDALFGPKVFERFRSARADIRDGGNCLALGCGSAAVFHLMRVVEHGLRALGKHLGVRRLSKEKKSKTTGLVISRKYTPIGYEQWENILNSLPKRVDKRLTKLRPGPAKQKWQAFYSPVLLDINAIREAWRNHIMHARQDATQIEAEGVKFRVEAIMRTLAERIREV